MHQPTLVDKNLKASVFSANSCVSGLKGHRRLVSKRFNNSNLSKNFHQKIHNSVLRKLKNVKNNNVVVNLSDRVLTLTESAVLNKGLNFCITNQNNNLVDKTLDPEIDKFIRTLQLRCMFRDQNSDQKPFTGNPNWKPPPSKCNNAISGFEQFIRKNVRQLFFQNKTRQNISKFDRKALLTLSKDKNIIIKKADKGGSIAVLNSEQYKNKMLVMLADAKTYTLTDAIDLNKAKNDVDVTIEKLLALQFIDKSQKRFLTQCVPKLPILYGLPKIHKNNWPLRPIVSQINSPAYRLNKYVDYLLTTAEKSIPNLLQDTTRFLQYVGSLPLLTHESILFTIDVTSLYTVLPHSMVIEYVGAMYKETLQNWNTFTPDIAPIPVDLLQTIIRLILNQTFFQFNDKSYLQNYGITMGAPSSVKLANITLYKHLQNIHAHYSGKTPSIQLRLIDDIFGIWSGNEGELENWVTFLNNSHDTIKFTLEHSRQNIPFLDTMVYIENNKVKTKLYKKPTDNKQYLHYNSEHPTHVKNSIPYAQALRYRRIIEDDLILQGELEKLKENFTSRLYPDSIVDSAIDKVLKLNRSEIIRYKPKTASTFNFTPFVLTFNNALVFNKNNNIYKLVSDSWKKLLVASPELHFLREPKIVFKRCSTICNLLVSFVFPPKRWMANKQNIPSLTTSINSITRLKYSMPCRSKRCFTCNCIQSDTAFLSTSNGQRFSLTHDMNCDSANIVYLITCSKCKLQYVGETSQQLRERMTGHRSCINLNKNTPIGIHFNSIGHDINNFTVTPIEIVQSNKINDRRAREYYWQLKLDTIFPKGLNAFPVEQRNVFENFEIKNANDLDIFWTLKSLELDMQ